MPVKSKKQKPLSIVGRRELISFPDLHLVGIEAKIDTGANTTALHCHEARVENGILIYTPFDPSHPAFTGKSFSTDQFEQKLVRSSFGESEMRYIIRTRIRIGKRVIRSIVSLTNRKNMRYPVLIGRRLLKNRFLVDVSLLHATLNP